jgi:hypothetical protein
VPERTSLSFRADVVNIFNRAQLGKPNVKWTGPSQGTTYGAITTPYTTSGIGTGTPRQMQFMLRLTFQDRRRAAVRRHFGTPGGETGDGVISVSRQSRREDVSVA